MVLEWLYRIRLAPELCMPIVQVQPQENWHLSATDARHVARLEPVLLENTKQGRANRFLSNNHDLSSAGKFESIRQTRVDCCHELSKSGSTALQPKLN